MDFLPILSTLRRHKTAAALIVLEIALTCAIVSNAVFLISDRLERMSSPSGLAEDELVDIMVTGIGTQANAPVVLLIPITRAPGLGAPCGLLSPITMTFVPMAGLVRDKLSYCPV